MVDGSVTGYLTILAIDIIIFLILVCVFSCYRKKRSKRVEITDEKLKAECPPPPIFYENEMGFCELMKKTNEMTTDEMAEKITPEAVLYLSLQKYIAIMLTIMAIFGCAILIPIYVITDEGDDLSDLQTTTISNIGDHLHIGIVPTLMIILYSVIAYIVVFKYVKDIQKYSKMVKNDTITSATIELYGIPLDSNLKKTQEEMEDKIKSKFSGDVEAVVVVPNLTEAYKAYRIKIDCDNHLEHFHALNERDGKKHMVSTSCLCCKKEDAIDHYEKKRTDAQAEFTKLRADYENNTTEIAYVICKDEETAVKVLQTIEELEYSFGKKLAASPAPGMSNIYWENLNANRKASATKGCCLTILFFLIVFFVCTPTTFIGVIESVIGGFVGAFIGGFLPMICIAIYFEVLIPAVINLLVRLEKHHTIGSAKSSAMYKFLGFFSIELFYFPTIITSVFYAVIHGEDIGASLPPAIARMGLDFLSYLSGMAFLTLGFWLLQAGTLISRFIKDKTAVTDRDRAMAWATNPFDVPKNMALFLTIMIISMAYVNIAPLVTLMGAVYFNIRYFADKYNISTLFYFDFESKGETPKKALNFVLIAIFTFQLISGLMMMNLGHHGYSAVGAVYALIAVVLLFLGVCCAKRVFVDKDIQYSKDSVDQKKAVLNYTHPLVKEEIEKDEAEKSGTPKPDADEREPLNKSHSSSDKEESKKPEKNIVSPEATEEKEGEKSDRSESHKSSSSSSDSDSKSDSKSKSNSSHSNKD